MSTQYTDRTGLGYWQLDDPNWHLPFQADMQLLDSLAPIGGLATRLREIPSTSLYVSIAPGNYRTTTGTVGTYAGSTLAVAASATTYLWLTDAGTLATGSAWPSGAYVPLAIVVSGASAITSITDARVTVGSVGVGPRVAVSTKTAAYTVLPTDGLVKGDATGGAFAITLPSAVLNPGVTFRAIKVDASANVFTVAAQSGQAINGAGSLDLTTQWMGRTFVSDGSNWMAL